MVELRSTQEIIEGPNHRESILFVDDEANMLDSFRREFLNSNYAIEFAEGVASALERESRYHSSLAFDNQRQ